jgi:hypothetical protein
VLPPADPAHRGWLSSSVGVPCCRIRRASRGRCPGPGRVTITDCPVCGVRFAALLGVLARPGQATVEQPGQHPVRQDGRPGARAD